jgi:hypothetical protein
MEILWDGCELIPFITVIVASLIGVFLTNTFLNRTDKKAQPEGGPYLDNAV